MKKVVLIILAVMVGMITINVLKERNNNEFITVTFPQSLYNVTKQEIDEEEISWYTARDIKAVKKENGLEITLTKKQRDELVDNGMNYINQAINMIKTEDKNYYVVPDEDYRELSIYVDEKVDGISFAATITALVGKYGYNYILQNETSDWNVHLKIYNCNNNKLVAEARLPEEKFECNPEDWEASYNE